MSSSGVTVLGSDAPTGYRLAPRTTEENPKQVTGSAPPLPPVSISPPTDTAAVVGGAFSLKKKRGRPRKYGPDGSVSMTLSVLGSDAPTGYRLAPRTTEENPNQVTGSAPPLPPVSISPPTDTAAVVGGAFSLKKKRGRPRKFGPDGSVSMTLSPNPLSSSAPPPVIGFSSVRKRGKVRYVGGSATKMQEPRMGTESLGEWVSCSVGANFTPHIIAVDAGEDITMKVISFSQLGPRAICIMSANGVISSVTLRQPDSSGGTLTYEGRFEILSLTGSFMPSETGGVRNRSGGMSVSLASPDGRVVGGGVAGLLVAASPVQIVVGSFLAGNQVEQKTKKHKHDPLAIIPAAAIPMSSAGMEGPYQTSPLFRGDSWSSMPPDSRNNPTDINVPLSG